MTKAFIESADAKEFVRMCAGRPKLMDDVRERAEMIIRLAGPLDKTEVFRALQPLVVIFGPPEFSDDAQGEALAKVWKSTYAHALRNVPYEALQFAVQAWIEKGDPENSRRSGSFPKPVDLIRLSGPLATKIHAAAWRVKLALKEVKSVPPPPTAEERARVQQMMAEFRSKPFQGFKAGGETQQQMAERLRRTAGEVRP